MIYFKIKAVFETPSVLLHNSSGSFYTITEEEDLQLITLVKRSTFLEVA